MANYWVQGTHSHDPASLYCILLYYDLSNLLFQLQLIKII